MKAGAYLRHKQIEWQEVKRVRKLLRQFGQTMVEVAMDLTPYKVGNNMRSIGMEVSGGYLGVFVGLKAGRSRLRVFTSSKYGAWLEFGTARMPARPYMAPAYRTAREEFEQTWDGGRRDG